MGTMEQRSLTTTTGEPFVIRFAQPDDAPNLLAYVRSVAQETGFFVIQPDEFPPTEEDECQYSNWDGTGRCRNGSQGGQLMQQGNQIGALQQQIMQQQWLRQQQRLRDGSGAGQGGMAGAINQQRIQSRQGEIQGGQATSQTRQRKQQRIQDCPAVQAAEVTP